MGGGEETRQHAHASDSTIFALLRNYETVACNTEASPWCPHDSLPIAHASRCAAVRTPGLGDTTYILSYAGLGVVVDPQRDVDRFLDLVSSAGVAVRYVLETHVHNDYVSGGRELARRPVPSWSACWRRRRV